jgi:hypothetical protein
MPDLAGMKRKAERMVDSTTKSKKRVPVETASMTTTCDDRLFMSRLPLTTTKTKLSEALGGAVKVVHWLTDQHTGAFYGSAICQMESAKDAHHASKKVVIIDKKKVRLTYCQRKETEVWPPLNFQEREYPPVGH